ncbi:MAG: STAS domain-containing protein [Chitinispirillales bacterium]|jgi:anti-anti-sigma factor|nr:STAS domain-containing protein [Chitinispirillales bacterium]
MDIGGREKRGFHIIDVVGKIDRLKDSIVLKSYMNSLIGKKIVRVALNLSQVTYMDSGALNVLLYCHNALKKNGGNLVLIELNEYVRDVLEVVGLTKIVTIYSTEEEFENESQKH